uniref:RING-type domain-containing protein n=1 Tax=viral metagenome TaxID=1070528 RepID=A0A6C0ANI7_9ZZZZ
MAELPMYFAVSHEDKFKLFQNTIYNRPDGCRVNVLWPIENARGHCLTMRLCNEIENTSIIRSWNLSEHDSCFWSYTGSSMNIMLESYDLLIKAPIVFMEEDSKDTLPFNSYSFTPSCTEFTDDHDTYTAARVYNTDPNSAANTCPIPRSRPVVPYRSPTPPRVQARAEPRAEPQAEPQVRPSLPAHITKIVLADSIRKNEVCPITSEDISETNATVTPCGHVFTTEAIQQWLSLTSSKGLCPVCKQKIK